MESENKKKIEIDYDGKVVTTNSSPMGPDRHDMATYVDGVRTSNIVVGYKDVEFDSKYLNLEEVLIALEKSILDIEPTKEIYFTKTGRKIEKKEVEKMFLDILKTSKANSINVVESKLRPYYRDFTVTPGLDKEIQKKASGTFMFSKNGIQLDSGLYVSETEINDALNKFMVKELSVIAPIQPTKDSKPKTPSDIFIGEPHSKTDVGDQAPEEKNNKYKVVLVKKSSIWAPLILSILVASAAHMPKQVTTETIVEDTVIMQEIPYDIDQVNTIYTYETEEETMLRNLENIVIGQDIYIDKEITYYESSDYNYGGEDNQADFGQFRDLNQNYKVDILSIVYEGKISKVSNLDGVSVKEEVEQFMNENNCSINDLNVMIHVGGPVSGWINAKDIFLDELQLDIVKTQYVEKYNYAGNCSAELGYITLEVDGTIVTINPYDDEGELLKIGAEVIGSDGQTYIINNLTIENTYTTDAIIENRTEIVYGITNNSKVNAALAILVAALGLTLTMKSKKKEEEEYQLVEKKDDLNGKNQITEEEYRKMVIEVDESFKKTSKFQELLKGYGPKSLSKIIFKLRNLTIVKTQISAPETELENDELITKGAR